MDFHLETAPISPAYGYAAAFEPRKPPRNLLVDQTEFATSIGRWADFFMDEKGLGAPTSAISRRLKNPLLHTLTVNEAAVAPMTAAVAQDAPSAPVAFSPQMGDVEVIARQRVKLIAAKYAGGVESSEIVARLEILNRRLSAIAPRVTPEQVTALEDANERLATIRAARVERAARLAQLDAST